LGSARLYGLRTKFSFAFVLKGRGFSRAANRAKSIAALAAEGCINLTKEFFRNHFSRAASGQQNVGFSPSGTHFPREQQPKHF